MNDPRTTMAPGLADGGEGPVIVATASEVDVALPLIEHDERSEVLALLEETMTVSKRQVATGKFRVSTRTESRDEFAEIALNRSVVDVTHVPIGKIVDVAPDVRTEGDTTIVPVVEERFVVVKQLFLKEEIRIRNRVETELTRTAIPLRRQMAVVERVDTEGRIITDGALPLIEDEQSLQAGTNEGENNGHS